MRHVIATVTAVLALCAACRDPRKQALPRAEVRDASLVDSGPPRVVTHEEIVKLFRRATVCTQGPCPEITELRALMKTSRAQVAAAALEIMADPLSRTGHGVGLETASYVEEWLASGLDEEARRQASRALERVTVEAGRDMRSTAFALLSEFRLPDAERILIAEVEDPARDGDDRYAAGQALGALIDDFSLIRRWLTDDRPFHWLAGLAMMKNFDLENVESRWDEQRRLVIALGKRPDLPGDVVDLLAFFYDLYLEDNPDDPEIRPLAERWTKHPDYMAAGQMRKILTAHPSKQPPR